MFDLVDTTQTAGYSVVFLKTDCTKLACSLAVPNLGAAMPGMANKVGFADVCTCPLGKVATRCNSVSGHQSAVTQPLLRAPSQLLRR